MDEAHNIDSVLIESMSVQLTQRSLDRLKFILLIFFANFLKFLIFNKFRQVFTKRGNDRENRLRHETQGGGEHTERVRGPS